MKILFMGTPDFALPSLQSLIESCHQIVGVLTQPDKPQGRKQVLTPPPVKTLALAHNIPVYQPTTLKNNAILPLLEEKKPDVIIVVAYGKILPSYVLEYPKYGCINVHGSLLPRWRGAAPIQWSIIAGDSLAGVTIMKMNEGLDTGDMLSKAQTEIQAQETAGSLFSRLSQMGATLLCNTLEQLDTLIPVPQEESQACYAHMLDKEMAVLDWTKSASELDCFIRGLNPWPIALTSLNGQRVKIYRAQKVEKHGEAGSVLTANAKEGLIIACGTDALQITELQMVGGKRMSANDYLRGHSIAEGSKFGT